MTLQEAALTGQMGLLQLLVTRLAWHLLLLLVPSLLQVPQCRQGGPTAAAQLLTCHLTSLCQTPT
jgi:hypothetical protein